MEITAMLCLKLTEANANANDRQNKGSRKLEEFHSLFSSTKGL